MASAFKKKDISREFETEQEFLQKLHGKFAAEISNSEDSIDDRNTRNARKS